jgi:hypothetical protein
VHGEERPALKHWPTCLRMGPALVLLMMGTSMATEEEAHAARSTSAPLEFKDNIIAGGPTDFMEVHHLLLRGSNYEIGKKLAQIARGRHGYGPIPYPDHRRTRSQLRYFEKHYPIHLERMRGAAAAFNQELNNHIFNFAGLYYGFSLTGCSAVYYPPNTTVAGRGVLSRNFDFTTGTFGGQSPAEGQLPACARPYLIEMYPDKGHASLVMCCFDLLGGVCDGLNSQGLAVALLADGEVMRAYGVDRPFGPQAGFNEIQIVRYLLDTCADVDQAMDTLLEAKLYYSMIPCHYIIADRHGRSFVWENSHMMHHGHIIPGEGPPLVTTNFMLHRHPDLTKLPEEEDPLGYFNRFRAIRKRLKGHEGKFDRAFIIDANRCVAQTSPPPPDPYVPSRTLWHALYYPEQRRLEIDFYLGEKADSTAPNGIRCRRSGYREFTLQH